MIGILFVAPAFLRLPACLFLSILCRPVQEDDIGYQVNQLSNQMTIEKQIPNKIGTFTITFILLFISMQNLILFC